MSTYLLLRNNQESGPFTFEEVKQMSLKSYDLLWVVGKSAAWLYAGEITELRAFAPPPPGKSEESFIKPSKPDIVNRNPATENSLSKINLQSRSIPRVSTKSVYVNLPVIEKKVSPVPLTSDILDPQINYKEPVQWHNGMDARPSKLVNFSSKLIWIGTVCLLFGTGILTGFFISDRRKFFSDGAKITQAVESSNKSVKAIQTTEREPQIATGSISSAPDSANSVKTTANTALIPTGKKKLKPAVTKQDSLSHQPVLSSAIQADSSLKPRSANNEELLYKKIKEHPENYVNTITGKYSTGIFGGISTIPITLVNNSPVKLDVVVVSIQYIQNNEKIYKTEDLSFFDIEPGESVTEKAPKSSRGIKITQHISMINSRQIDLHYIH
jgi:hypothetical protein